MSPRHTRTVCLLVGVLGAGCVTPDVPRSREPRLSDEPIPMRPDLVPSRTPPILELGDPFYGPGPIQPGYELATGAVLQPSFQVFGSLRSAAQVFAPGRSTTTEWVNRLDLYGNLQLTGTERILVGLRPLDEEGDFTGYVFRSSGEEGWNEELNPRLSRLFFEGELLELLPFLDPRETRSLDLGLTVGRQPVLLQDGLLVDDTIDAVGITRNTLRPPGFSNLRLTGLVGFNDVHRDDNREDESARLYGLSAEADLAQRTVSFDALWVDDASERTDAVYLGFGSLQSIAGLDTTLRAVGSFPSRGDAPEVGGGGLVFLEASRTLAPLDELLYVNAFVGIDEFSSAARGPSSGGPLGRTGILFGSVGMGSYGAPLGNRPDDSVGGAVGCQLFADREQRSQWILELGARTDTDHTDRGALGCGFRHQRALGRRLVLRLDGFAAAQEGDDPAAGLRVELLLKL